MKKEEKAKIVEQIQDYIVSSKIGILTNYKGLKTTELSELRIKLKTVNGKYIVTKNTLARFAAERAGIKQLEGLLTDSTAIAFGFGEPQELARALNEYIRGSKTPLVIKGGFLGPRILTKEDVSTLITLPPIEVLLSHLMGQLQSPVTMLMRQLNAPVSGLVNVLNARKEQLEEGK